MGKSKTSSRYTDIITPSGSKFNNAEIKGSGNVSFKDSPKNQFDKGIRFAKDGSYKILNVVESIVGGNPSKSIKNNGFFVQIGDIVDIELTKDITNTIPTELIIMTNTYDDGGDDEQNNSTNTTNKTFTTKNIIIGIIIVGVVFSILKYKKII